MLLLFSVRIIEWPPVWERPVHSVNHARVFRERDQFVCVLLSVLALREKCKVCVSS